MKLKQLLTIALAGFLVTACQQSIDIEHEKMALMQADRDFAKTSVELGATEAFNMFLDTNALKLPPGQRPIRGKDNIYQQMQTSAGSYTMSWEPRESDVAASGDLGYTWGIYKITVKNKNGRDTEIHGKYLNIWKKQPDGTWKVLVDIGNQTPEGS